MKCRSETVAVRVGRIPDRIPDRRDFPSGDAIAVRVVRVSGPPARTCVRTARARAWVGARWARTLALARVRVLDLCLCEERRKP